MLGTKVSIYVYGQLICLLIGFLLANEPKNSQHQGHSLQVKQKEERDRSNLLCSVWKILCGKEGTSKVIVSSVNTKVSNYTSKICSLQNISNRKNHKSLHSSIHSTLKKYSNSHNHGNYMKQFVNNSKYKEVLLKNLQNYPVLKKVNFIPTKVPYSTDYAKIDYFLNRFKTRTLKMQRNNDQKSSDVITVNPNDKNDRAELINSNTAGNVILIKEDKNTSFNVGIDPVSNNGKIIKPIPLNEANFKKTDIDTEIRGSLENDSKQTTVKFQNNNEIAAELFKEQLHLKRNTTTSNHIDITTPSTLPTNSSMITYTVPLKGSHEETVNDNITSIFNPVLLENRLSISPNHNRKNNHSENITDFKELIHYKNLKNTMKPFLNTFEEAKKSFLPNTSSYLTSTEISNETSNSPFNFNKKDSLELRTFNSTVYKLFNNQSNTYGMFIRNDTLSSENSNNVRAKTFHKENSSELYTDTENIDVSNDKLETFSEDFIERDKNTTIDRIFFYSNSSENLNITSVEFENRHKLHDSLEFFIDNFETLTVDESNDFNLEQSEVQNRSLSESIPKQSLEENNGVQIDTNLDASDALKAITEPNLNESNESISVSERLNTTIDIGFKMFESITMNDFLNLNVTDEGSDRILYKESNRHYDEKSFYNASNLNFIMDRKIEPEDIYVTQIDIPVTQITDDEKFNLSDSSNMIKSEKVRTDPMETTSSDRGYGNKFKEPKNMDFSSRNGNFKQEDIYISTNSYNKENEHKYLFKHNLSTALNYNIDADINVSLKDSFTSEAFSTSKAETEIKQINNKSLNITTNQNIPLQALTVGTLSDNETPFETNSSDILFTEEFFEISDLNGTLHDYAYSTSEFKEDFKNVGQTHKIDNDALSVSKLTTHDSESTDASFQNNPSFHPGGRVTSEDSIPILQDDSKPIFSISSKTNNPPSVAINPTAEKFRTTPFAELTTQGSERIYTGFENNLSFPPGNRITPKYSKSDLQEDSKIISTASSKILYHFSYASVNPITEMFGTTPSEDIAIKTPYHESDGPQTVFENKIPLFPENKVIEGSKSVLQNDFKESTTFMFDSSIDDDKTTSEIYFTVKNDGKINASPKTIKDMSSQNPQTTEKIFWNVISSSTETSSEFLKSSRKGRIMNDSLPVLNINTQASKTINVSQSTVNFSSEIANIFSTQEIVTEPFVNITDFPNIDFPNDLFTTSETITPEEQQEQSEKFSSVSADPLTTLNNITPSPKKISKPFDVNVSDLETDFRNDLISTPVNKIKPKDHINHWQHSTIDIFSSERNEKSFSGSKMTTEIFAHSSKLSEERLRNDFVSTQPNTMASHSTKGPFAEKETNDNTKYLDASKTLNSKETTFSPEIKEFLGKKYTTLASETVIDNNARTDLTLDKSLKPFPLDFSEENVSVYKTETNSVTLKVVTTEALPSSFGTDLEVFPRVSTSSTYMTLNEKNPTQNVLTAQENFPEYFENYDRNYFTNTKQLFTTEDSENNINYVNSLADTSSSNILNVISYENKFSADSVDEQKIDDSLIRTERDVLKQTENSVDADQPLSNIDILGNEIIRTERDLSLFDKESTDFDSISNKNNHVLKESLVPLPGQLDDININIDSRNNETEITINPPELLSSPASLDTINQSLNLKPNIEKNTGDTEVSLKIPKEFEFRPELDLPGNSKVDVKGTVGIDNSGRTKVSVSGSVNTTVGSNINTTRNVSFDKTESENNLKIDVSGNFNPPAVPGKRDSETNDVNFKVNLSIAPFPFSRSFTTVTENLMTNSHSDESSDNSLSPPTPSPNLNSKSEVEVEYEDVGDNPLSHTTETAEEMPITISYRSTEGHLTKVISSNSNNDQQATDDTNVEIVIKPLITSVEGTTLVSEVIENTAPNVFVSPDSKDSEESVSKKEPKNFYSSSTQTQVSTNSQYQTTIATTESTIIPFHFTIDANYDEVVGSRKKKFEEHLTKQLGIAMRVPLDCIQNLQVKKGSIEVNFDLVPNPDHGHLADEKALKAAADELKRMIDNGQITINDIDGNTLVVVPLDPPTEPPPANKMEHTTLILGVVIGAFILTVITVAIAAIVVKRKSNVNHRLSPIEEVRSKLPSYREIPFQEALFMKGVNRDKLILGKYSYDTGQWLGPGPEPKLFHPPESVVYRPPTDSEVRRTPRPPTAIRERLKYDWEVDWDSMVSSR
ncbi:uncharacterized protein NPIL_11911 [Nephila pilipes]|uniref:Uncharacterized protein n=1 Tax=Nephila pilipes TaxID=299642 RepID=A0A8X6NJW8_NEPPI|nr:uncharacterized protein NPIL_11911 [Nephila pilipes]